MTGARRDGEVHQAFFGVGQGGSKHDMIACSLYGHEVKKWQVRLQKHVRLEPTQGGELPSSALSYLRFDDGMAALVRRVDRGHSQGRGNAHVLIGVADVLDVPLSLGLAEWEGWRDTAPPEVMLPIRARDLAEAPSWTRWSPRAVERIEDPLVTVLAHLLDHPGDPLSVIGCPDGDRLAMVWGLRGAADDHLRSRRNWTYSTYERRHDVTVQNLPEIVFLPEPPNGGAARRTVVNLRHPSQDLPSRSVALGLVDAFLRGRTAAVPTAIPGVEHRSRPNISEPPHRLVPGEGSRSGLDVSNVGKQWGRNLLGAQTRKELKGTLDSLVRQGSDTRAQVRGEIDEEVVDILVEKLEADAAATTRDLLFALYGPDFEDLRTNQRAQAHAVALVRKSRSGALARFLGSTAVRLEIPDLATAAFQRWEAGYVRPRSFHPRRTRWSHRPAMPKWVFPAAIAVPVLLVLLTVFLLGREVGRSAEAQPTTSAVTPSAEAPLTPPATQPTGRPVRVTTVDSNHTLYAFVKNGDAYYPQQRCVKEEEDNTGPLWRCAQVGDQPPKAELVAIEVLSTDLFKLDELAADKRKATQETSWGSPVVVP